MKLSIGTACPMSWESLRGDDRVRFCERCRLNVYNLADMAEDEVGDLVERTEGRLCGRLYVREEGFATVRECGWARQRRWMRRVAMSAVVLILSGFGLTLAGAAGSSRVSGTVGAWVTRCLEHLGLIQQPRILLGDITPSLPVRKGFFGSLPSGALR